MALQGLIEDHQLKWDVAICGYPGQRVAAHILEFPFGGVKKIDQSLAFELENYIPFDLDRILIDYNILSSNKESSEVLAFYVMKEPFAQWLDLMKGVPIDPKIVAHEGVELLNLMVLGMVPPEGPYILLDIGHSKAILTLCRGKKLYFSRTISVGGKKITEAIQKKLNVSLEEAEKIKIEMAGLGAGEGGEVLDDLSKQVGEVTQEVMEDLVLNLRQVLFSYQDKQGEPVGGIYLTGGTSRLPGIDRFLSMQLKKNVTHIDSTEFHFNRLGKVESHRAVMSQGLALALRGVAVAGMPDLQGVRKDL